MESFHKETFYCQLCHFTSETESELITHTQLLHLSQIKIEKADPEGKFYNIEIEDKDDVAEENSEGLCDVTLDCEDKQIKTQIGLIDIEIEWDDSLLYQEFDGEIFTKDSHFELSIQEEINLATSDVTQWKSENEGKEFFNFKEISTDLETADLQQKVQRRKSLATTYQICS